MTALAFVDLETTGATAASDRITEIGIVTVDADGTVEEWQQLVNPGMTISPFIENLTGISNAMVAAAPDFAEVASEVERRLAGRLFIAHNANFDYGFLKAEFRRLDRSFRAPVLCTVKLSRLLFPEHKRHALDVLIERHGLVANGRHRALADAQLIHQFWQKIHQAPGPETVAAALAQLDPPATLPPAIDPAVAETLPDSTGVFMFYGDAGRPLFVSRAKDIRKRVLSHFQGAAAKKQAKLAALVRHIDWIETAGEIEAQIRERRLIAELSPGHNRPKKGTAPSQPPVRWPFAGPAILREGETVHVVDQWRHLGLASSEDEVADLLLETRPAFDNEIFAILLRHVARLTPLPALPAG